jgi:hypothetical protein
MKRLLLRFLWFFLLIAQTLLYVISYPHLGEQQPWGEMHYLVMVLDFLGGLSWCGVLVVAEGLIVPVSRVREVEGFRYGLMVLFAVGTIGIVYFNFCTS